MTFAFDEVIGDAREIRVGEGTEQVALALEEDQILAGIFGVVGVGAHLLDRDAQATAACLGHGRGNLGIVNHVDGAHAAATNHLDNLIAPLQHGAGLQKFVHEHSTVSKFMSS